MVADLKPSLDGVWVEGTIAEKTETGMVQTRYGEALFCTALLEDETGRIRINLFRDQTQVKVGDRVIVENGFTNPYGELSIGKRGKITISKT